MPNASNLFNPPIHIVPPPDNKDVTSNDYIIDKAELNVLLNNIGNNLRHPVTIIDFNKESKSKNEDREDSKITSVLIHYFCETLRKCAKAELCALCDSKHARLFKGINLGVTDIKTAISNKIYREEHKDEKINNSLAKKPLYITFEKNPKRGYLQYECPISGLIELIFPIIIENVIVGVLFIGQIHIDDPSLENHAKKIRIEFFNNHEKLFDEYIKHYPKQNIENIRKILLSSDDPRDVLSKIPPLPVDDNENTMRLEWKPKKITQELFKDLIEKANKEVCILENELKEALVNKRKNQVEEAVKIISDYLNEVMQQDILNDDYEMDSFWDDLEDKMTEMVNLLGIRYLSIFTVPNGHKNGGKKFNLVAHAAAMKGDKSGIEKSELKKIVKFDFSNIDLSNKNDNILSTIKVKGTVTDDAALRNALIIENAPDSFRRNRFFLNSDIFFYPVRKNMSYSIVCSVGYKDDLDYNDENGVRTLISQGIVKLLNSIMLAEYLLLDDITSKLNYKTLRIYRHEISHIVLGLRYNNDKYFKNSVIIKNLTDSKIQNIYRDNEAALTQLNLFTQDMGILVGTSVSITKEEVKIFNDIIYKWRNMFENELFTQNKEFVITEDSDTKAVINTDKQRLDQIFYSLLSNAIKYSFWGTRIVVGFRCINKKYNKYSLTLTNYGYKIENNEEPYELYKRGSTEGMPLSDGSGIGLYIVKSVSEKIGASVSHNCELLSIYNIPLIERFVNLPKEKLPLTEYDNLTKVKNKNKKSFNELLAEVVSRREHYHQIADIQIIEEIKRPVYKITFEVII